MEQSNLSRHLAKLKQAGLVSSVKKGQFAYYTRKLVAAPYHQAIEQLYGTMSEDPTWEADRVALAGRANC